MLRIFRITERTRLVALVAMTAMIVALWTTSFFRVFVFGIEFLTIDPDGGIPDKSDLEAGIRNWRLSKWSVYLGTSRTLIGVGRELVPDWRGNAYDFEFPRFQFKSFRSYRDFGYTFEFESFSKWYAAGLGPFHYDTHPMGGLTATPYDDRGFVIPHWLMATIVVVLWWRRWRAWRIHRRVMHGGCPGCGYDLRGSPVVGLLVSCPECGEATIAPEIASDLAASSCRIRSTV